MKGVIQYDKTQISFLHRCQSSCVFLLCCSLRKRKFGIILYHLSTKSTWSPFEIQQSEMIRKIAHVLSKWLLKTGAISEVDLELYEYGIYSFLFTTVPLLAVIVLSFPLHITFEGILFIIPFILLWISFFFRVALYTCLNSRSFCFSSGNQGSYPIIPKHSLLRCGVPFTDSDSNP